MLRKAIQAVVGCVVLLCLGIGFASAQPATAPAAQALDPVDQTTPKGALKMLSRATQSGETATLKQLFHATNPQQQKIADSMIDRADVFAKFRAALVSKFGEDAATKLTDTSPADEMAAEARIEQATVKVDNDKASVTMKSEVPGDPDPDAMQMVKVDGKWKLPMAPITDGMDAPSMEAGLRRMKLISEAVTQTTADVSSGKYQSPDEVNDAIRGKLASAMLAEAASAAAANPATRPATAPAAGQ
jgi:hypothetical protein